MNRGQLRLLALLAFFFVFLLTFPLHHIKDSVFEKISKATANQVQIYAQDISLSLRGLKLSGVNIAIQNFYAQVSSLSALPSLTCLFHGALGLDLGVSGFFNADLNADIGKKFSGYYFALESDSVDLAQIPLIAQYVPNIVGKLAFDASLSMKNMSPPDGSGDVRVAIPTLSIPKPFSVSGFHVPAISQLKPGLVGSMKLEKNVLNLKGVQIGAQGQSLSGTVDGTVTLDSGLNNPDLDLAILLKLSQELLDDPTISSLIKSVASPYMKGSDTIALNLTGPLSAPLAQPQQ